MQTTEGIELSIATYYRYNTYICTKDIETEDESDERTTDNDNKAPLRPCTAFYCMLKSAKTAETVSDY